MKHIDDLDVDILPFKLASRINDSENEPGHDILFKAVYHHRGIPFTLSILRSRANNGGDIWTTIDPPKFMDYRKCAEQEFLFYDTNHIWDVGQRLKTKINIAIQQAKFDIDEELDSNAKGFRDQLIEYMAHMGEIYLNEIEKYEDGIFMTKEGFKDE